MKRLAIWTSLILLLIINFSFFYNVKSTQLNFTNTNIAPEREDYIKRRSKSLVNVGDAIFDLTSPKFSCKKYLKSRDKLDFLHIAFLYNTFGNKFDCVKTLLQDPRLMTIEINLINEPGHRNRRLESHEFLHYIRGGPAKYSRLLKSRNKDLKKRFDAYVVKAQNLLMGYQQPHTKCFINPGLESNVSVRAGKVLVEWAREAFPQCSIVWNPLHGKLQASRTGANLAEGHGPGPNFTGPCITNLDGTDINFPDRLTCAAKTYNEEGTKNWINSGNALRSYITEYANRCEVAFLWVGEYNQFNFDECKAWEPPTKRGGRKDKIFDLVGKEIAWAHSSGKVIPKDLEFTDADKQALASCDVVRTKWNDGEKRGRLLKQSEFSDRGGVILTSSDLSSATSIKILYRKTVVDTYRRIGTYGHDNSRRILWRSNISPVKYPVNVVIQLKVKNKNICYKIKDPQIRHD